MPGTAFVLYLRLVDNLQRLCLHNLFVISHIILASVGIDRCLDLIGRKSCLCGAYCEGQAGLKEPRSHPVKSDPSKS